MCNWHYQQSESIFWEVGIERQIKVSVGAAWECHIQVQEKSFFQKPLEPSLCMVRFEATTTVSTYDPFPTAYHGRPCVYKSFN